MDYYILKKVSRLTIVDGFGFLCSISTVPEIPFEVPLVSVVGNGGIEPCYVLTSYVLIWTG